MPGPLLKSATLKTYHPVGAVGHPVYLAAAQLRAAVGRRLGADVADVFAIPQRNEDGDCIDWYAPNPGTVVPWSAATEAERVTAQSRLLEVRERIEDLGRSMEAEASAERQVFGRLLAQVMQFPDEQDVHLVNGQPVLTFWGFVRDRAEVGSDPLRDLSLHVAPQAGKRAGAGAGAVADPADKQPPVNGRRPWWLWLLLGLLLLLLLGLLLWGLRGCVPMLDPTGEPTPNTEPMPGSDSLGVDRSEALNLFGQDRLIEAETGLSETDTITMRRDARVDDSDTGSSIRDRVERTFVDGGVSSVRDAATASSASETLAAETMVDTVGVDADVLADRASVSDDRIDETLTLDGLENSGPMTLGGEADLPLADAVEALVTDTQGQDPGDALAADEVLSDVAAADPLAADEQADGAAAEGLSGPSSEPNKVEGDGAGEGESEGDRADEGEGSASASDAGDEASAADQAVALTDASAPAADDQAPTGTDAASAAADAAAADSGDAPSTDSSASEDASSASTPGSGLDASAAAAAARAASTGTGTSTPTGAVRIPPRELLNSSWRTTRTLQDPKDGSPVQLGYRLQDGSGKVRLTRQDGSLCQSDAQATVRDGRLVVDSQQDIVCADGTNFGRPQLDCIPQAGGRARCVGRYADGSSVPIEMRRQPD